MTPMATSAHWALWLLALAAAVALIMKIGRAWDARVQQSSSDSTIRKLNKPARFFGWVGCVCLSIALGLTFPLNTNDKREGRDCRQEFDNRGQAVECG